MQDVTLWQAFESLVTSKDFLYALAYFAIGIGITAIFMFVMIICEAFTDALQPIMFGAFIMVGWPVFLFLCVFWGIPHLIYVILRESIQAYKDYKWRKYRKTLR